MHNDSLIDIKAILNDYTEEIQNGITKDAQEVANKGAKELRNTTGTYKIRTGKYNKGWKVKTDKGSESIHCTIHNSTNYQLTHLLEKGHRMVGRDGRIKGNVKAYIHIAPVEEKCIKEYEAAVTNTIKNGG